MSSKARDDSQCRPGQKNGSWPNIVSAAVNALFVLQVSLVANGCGPRHGKLVFEPAELEVASDDSASPDRDVSVVLRNTGNAPLKIAGINPSCACTVIQAVSGADLPVDGSANMTIRVSLPVYGTSDVAVVAKAESGDVSPAILTLHLRGSRRVPHFFRGTPSVRLTGNVPDELESDVVELVTDEATDSTPWVTGLESDSPDVTTELIERKADQTLSAEVTRYNYVFLVRGVTPSKCGTVASYLTVRTTSTRAGTGDPLRSIQIRVLRGYVPPVRLVPDELIARQHGRETPIVCVLLVVADDDPFFDVTLDSQAEWYKATKHLGVPGVRTREWKLRIEIDPTKYAKQVAAGSPEIVLLTTHPHCGAVRVPVHLLVD